MNKMISYSDEELMAEIERRTIVMDVSKSQEFKESVFKELSKLDWKFLVDHPTFRQAIENAQNLTRFSRRNILVLGSKRLKATYVLTDFNENGRMNLKLVEFMVNYVSLTNRETLRILFDTKIFTKSQITYRINRVHYWRAYKNCQDYLLRNLDPVAKTADFKAMERFNSIEGETFLLD